MMTVLPSAKRLSELAELGVIEFPGRTARRIIERRLKTIWEERSCPNCGTDSLHALNSSDHIWCDRCDWKTTYTQGTPFDDEELTLIRSSECASTAGGW
jgi:ribosomal protein L37AE/L43A